MYFVYKIVKCINVKIKIQQRNINIETTTCKGRLASGTYYRYTITYYMIFVNSSQKNIYPIHICENNVLPGLTSK